ncbi:type II toxin-antitoxin system Phd/YefM family antitoxin [Lactobacillus salivarius]|uniref:type II toxin-antitoxin system Phd/YefM family antitoxin n=1 Tax=Ligilactobacillus salivarius TaxID=1624 RepID=UPI0015C64A66|nr:type II toxin-antitoxin system prevent-host-death family antitoxin [Ligilactobacillus salivarius]NXZ96739.1 type II toxin-antitoxin system Phd/YefM family antitoxin [Ligilactobacillus salivarius]NYA60053.1 type II toxin-antitoxin system Phd/YefM family antitoxin [Ligilactobacillus salivarius]NYA61757.1 type II toxin-antitoxin system Phd/YefM family antitoxin [Ligilactobacillus salivarius]NYA68161.1 type II toxin-antitoxin system Phd/YefM family antitoxin [Ligilactobacillus salivarius]NYA730
MTQVTATELKNNLGKYLKKSEFEDIYITKNGVIVSVLSNPNQSKLQMLDDLKGIAPDMNMTDEELRNERISNI